MKTIKCLSETIENTLDMAEDRIRNAIVFKEECPVAAKALYTQSVSLMDSIKGLHDSVVTLIDTYRKETGEPPAPMMTIYNYMHERHIIKAAAIKNLQDMYTK